MLTTLLLYLRLMIYPLLAYGFFLLATYRFPLEHRRADALQRGLYAALSGFFGLMTVAAILRYTGGYDAAMTFYDLSISPAALLVLAFVGLSLARRHGTFPNLHDSPSHD